jgi:uncharacterized protein YqhQ
MALNATPNRPPNVSSDESPNGSPIESPNPPVTPPANTLADVRANAPSYGGQAVIEGVMMRGPRFAALSVRAPDGEIVTLVKKAEMPSARGGIFGWPIIRGALSFWDSLTLGIGMLMRSAEISMPDEEAPSKLSVNLAVAMGGLIAIGLFVVLPVYIAPFILSALRLSGRFATSLVELIIRLALLVGYVVTVSRMDDIQRVLQYHGAEHKVIWAWEHHHDDPALSKENWDRDAAVSLLSSKASACSRLHPRCGTSFLFIVALCSWLVFIFVSTPNVVDRIIFRLLLMPLVAGLSYELLKASAGAEGTIWTIIKAPGIGLQKLTTREPDASQIEVAAGSLSLLIEAERGVS